MRRGVALLLGVLVPLLGLAGVGNAQSTLQLQGTIQAVDCQAQTVTIATSDSANTIAVAPYTAVLVDSRAVPLCGLQQYIGSPATIWLVANGNEFIATRIDTTAQAAVAPLALPAQQEAIAPLPIAGIVLGTILLAGLIYLLVRDYEGRYYRYPYYGEYYQYYYRPEYRVYTGPYPAVCPVVYAAAPITGVVIGITIVSGLDYLIVRHHDGHYERYPYYGPYRTYYYRPEYRVYSGPVQYINVPIHYGDTRGTVVLHRTDGPAPYQRPTYVPAPQPQPVQYQRPNYTPVPEPQPVQYQRPPYSDPRPYQPPNSAPVQPQPVQYQRPNYMPVPPQQPVQYQRPNYTPVPQPQPVQYQRPPYSDPRPYQPPNSAPVQPQPVQYQRPNYMPVPPQQPVQYQRPNYTPVPPQQPVQYQRPSYTPVPPQQPVQYQRPSYSDPRPYQQTNYAPPQYPRPNYTPAPQRTNDNSRGPQQNYRESTQPGNRGRDTRQVCQSNGQGQSCQDGTHNR